MRVVAAMSGGVDSSVAAALLQEQGHEVIGISMQLYNQQESSASFGSCCSIDDLQDARRVAVKLGFPHYIVNLEREFNEQVVASFVKNYAAARTPIPCVNCNGELKFAHLLDRARGFDAAAVATGHYARVEHDANRGYLLKRGLDQEKDQSYFLFTMTQDQLSGACFPLGELTKSEVRSYASTRKLSVANKPDSHDICFIPDNDYAAFIERQKPETRRSGPIANIDGAILGQHQGVHHFTVGQRRGLGVSSSIPLYVVSMDADSNTVTVGPRKALEQTTLTASEINWISGVPPTDGIRIGAQVRHRHEPANAILTSDGTTKATVEFDTPQPAISPGQAVVFYDGEIVIGGGWIN